jgi:hopanoid biosynthesis associated radical SAM protein HpnH
MAIPFHREMRIGAYILKQKLKGRKRYPLVLMLEPLFRCNLACTGCGKIDYPDAILNRRLSVKECLDAAEECGAPMVAIPGGEPLIHKEIGEIVKGLVARKKYVSLCTNALLLEKKLHLFEPSEFLFFSVHLDGIKEHHDKSVCMEGGFERAVSAIKAAKAKGFTVNVNATIFDGHPAKDIAAFLDLTQELRITSSIAARPRNCSARSSTTARAGTGSSCTRPCSWTSWPATRPSTARRGACRRATFSAGRSLATSWAKATPRPSRS